MYLIIFSDLDKGKKRRVPRLSPHCPSVILCRVDEKKKKSIVWFEQIHCFEYKYIAFVFELLF